MKNKLISIGWLGTKAVYVNVPREDAIRRYLLEYPGTSIVEEAQKRPDLIQEFEFDDQFWAYDVAPPY